jgi:signal peptidase I
MPTPDMPPPGTTPPGTTPPGMPPTVPRSPLRETIELVAVALVLAFAMRTLVIQAFRIPTGSMEDTLLVGDFILVDKLTFGARIDFGPVHTRLPGLRSPRTGDVIVFRYPLEPDKDFVKRLIAGPGQTVRMEQRRLYVDDRLVPDPPHSKHIDPQVLSGVISPRDNFGPLTVPEGFYFFMGDNRENSKDSREWGFVPEANLKGRAMIIYLSWNPEVGIPWYDLLHKLRWDRLFRAVR